jgi:hypothetical protein
MKKLVLIALLLHVMTACGDKDKNKDQAASPTNPPLTLQQDSPENAVRGYMQAYADKNADAINSLLCNSNPSLELWAEASMWDGIDSIRLDETAYTVQEQSASAARVSFTGKVISVAAGDETASPVIMYFQLRFLDEKWCVAEN